MKQELLENNGLSLVLVVHTETQNYLLDKMGKTDWQSARETNTRLLLGGQIPKSSKWLADFGQDRTKHTPTRCTALTDQSSSAFYTSVDHAEDDTHGQSLLELCSAHQDGA